MVKIDRKALEASIRESARTIAALRKQLPAIQGMAEALVGVLQSGGKVLSAGNGGSAAEALHLTEELIGRFAGNRPALPGISLVADTTALTCISNDFGYDAVFSRQVEGLGEPGDMLFLFTTSGKARNLRQALHAAKERRLVTACLLGRDGGPMAGKADYEVIVPGTATARIQEAHQVLLHLMLEVVEGVFGAKGSG